jgi:hypothetical protein
MADDDTQVDAPAQADTATDPPVQTEQVATETTTEQAPAQADTAPPPEPRKWAAKYTSPEVLEEAHLNLQRQFTQETQRNAELARQINVPAKTPATTTPSYTPEQLEGAKIDLLDKMAEARTNGDSQKAREYASQIVWCDRELMNQRVSSTQTLAKSQAAEQSLMAEVAGVVQQFSADLVPGNPLYEKAATLLDRYVEMGMPNNAITQSHAVTMAAQLLGKTKSSVEQDTRRELTKTIQSTLKSGVIAGAGHATHGAPSAPDFMSMTDAQFDAWKQANVR